MHYGIIPAITRDLDSHISSEILIKELLNSITTCLSLDPFDVIGLIIQRSCIKVSSKHLRINSYLKQFTHIFSYMLLWCKANSTQLLKGNVIYIDNISNIQYWVVEHQTESVNPKINPDHSVNRTRELTNYFGGVRRRFIWRLIYRLITPLKWFLCK